VPGYGGYVPPGGFPGAGGGFQNPYGGGFGSFPQPIRPNFASYGQRVGAFLIDAIVQFLMYIPLAILLSAYLKNAPTQLVKTTDANTGELKTSTLPDSAHLRGAAAIAVVFVLALWIFYFGYLQGKRGQTLGKKALSVRVVDSSTGQPIGMARGFFRHFVMQLLGLFCGIVTILDLLWPAWDSDKQALHDKMFSSHVIRS
jgi:uncharacterized RDD family membrane protein YckC